MSDKTRKFEYKIVPTGLVSGEKIVDVEKAANELGEDGWELVTIARNDYAVFKREV